MTEQGPENAVSIQARQRLIRLFPCFAALSAAQCQELALLMHEQRYSAGEKIVNENELVDSIYLVVEGEAEVTKEIRRRKRIRHVPVAILGVEESIGLNDTGFYSTTGHRTATVTALTPMLLLKLDIKDLSLFLKKHRLESVMYAASLQMLRMQFIKQSLPFSKLSRDRLQWLANHVEDVKVPAGTFLFHQGDEGDKCYMIRAGEVEILATNEAGEVRQLALLKPPVLFGEATLISHTPRNASAKSVTECELLVLRHEYLSELIESEEDVANMFMTLMVDRSRPLRNPHVTVHQRITADGQALVILKNPDNGSYFNLSKEGAYIWRRLDGKHTMQDITLDLADRFHVFAPDVVAALISRLTKAGFIHNLEMPDESRLRTQPLWIRSIVNLRRLLETRVAFGDADKWITRMYQKYIRYLFTVPAQLILAILAVAGFIAFVLNTETILTFFSRERTSLFLVLGLIPLSMIEVLLHELGHAFTVKAFGREVHYIGVGWYWFTPIAFTDTSDMWLSSRKPRMAVNLSGVYVDILIAGLAALLIFLVENPYVQGMFWLFALYTYIGGLRNLSPLQEMDGYYVLMDGVEKPRLRQAAVVWLVRVFPKSLRHPRLLKKYKAEIIYWLACFVYLTIVTILTLVVQAFVFNVLGIRANPYVSLIIPFLVVIFSCVTIIADIRSQAEK